LHRARAAADEAGVALRITEPSPALRRIASLVAPRIYYATSDDSGWPNWSFGRLRRGQMSRVSEAMDPSPGDLVRIESKGPATETAIIVDGELDMSGATGFLAHVREAIGTRPGSIAVDARGLTFMDSSGLRSFLLARAAAVEAGVAFRISEPSPALRDLVQRTGLQNLLLDE
jgi:anti-anti-sigma factor